MARNRFGSGQCRYLNHPLPDLVDDLRRAFYSCLLPIARLGGQLQMLVP